MRLALSVLLALAASASADAQARFVDACVASAGGDGMAFEPTQVCGCAASGAMAAGVTPADLDGLIDYVKGDDIDPTDLPEAMQAASASVTESLLACALAQDAGGAAVAGSGAPATMPAAATPAGRSDSGSGTVTVRPPVAPTGLRTGNGGGAVQTNAPGPGAAIRVVGGQ